MLLQGKKIVLAITGSIAAYKTPQLVRLLIREGAEVQVLMTQHAHDFVTPLSLATVSKKEVFSSLSNGSHWNNHVHLGRWADVLLVAPCSAHTLARMANGICDNMVQAVYLSANCPVIIAPAMDEDMWLHPATKSNLERVQSYGNTIIPVAHGELASGIIGEGRMAEPEAILDFLAQYLNNQKSKIKNQKSGKALVTAGPTYEYIDPVRFIGNFSTGKMGLAVAQALAENGYEVELVLGPAQLSVNNPGIHITNVTTAQEMYDACIKLFPDMDIAVMSAAVADFRPKQRATQKIKKQKQESFSIDLVQNPDILAALGKIKKPHQTLVGFALETHDELAHAEEKLRNKNADFIALNSLRDENAGFGFDTNKVTLIGKDNFRVDLPLQSKREIAKSIVACVTGNA